MLALLESFLMYPAPDAGNGDWQADWLAHEDVEFASADGTQLHGWYCEHPEPQRVILFCHGNGEHVAYLAEELDFLREEFRASVFAFDYRGYGKSEGSPYEQGILQDGEAAQQWLAQKSGVAEDQVIVWGRSLGGAVAVHLAATNGSRALVLDRTFSSMVDVAASHYPWLPVRWLLRNRYPSESRIKRYSGPLFQVHGQPDRVVPFEFGVQLHQSCESKDKVLLESPTLTHNQPWSAAEYQRLLDFLDQL